jgi:hypothetical protein
MKKTTLLLASTLLALGSYAQLPVAHYDFSNVTGGVLYDVQNGINGNIYNSITPAAGVAGVANTALKFDGVSTFADVADDARLHLTSWTISATVMFNQFNNDPSRCQVTKIMERGVQGSNDFYSLEVNDNNIDNSCSVATPGGKQFFGMAAGTGPAVNSYPITYPLSTGVWYCLTATYEANAGIMSTYINGALFYSTTWTNQYAPPPFTGYMLIGRASSFSWPYRFNGIMDELWIYDVAMTAGDVSALCGPIPPPVSGPCTIHDLQFCTALSTPYTYTFTPSTVVGAGMMPMDIEWSWNDGSPNTLSNGDNPVTHTFPAGSGSYAICAQPLAPCDAQAPYCFTMCMGATGVKPTGNGNGPATLEEGIGDPYPNPTNSELYIPVGKLTGTIRMDVTGIDGRLIFSKQLNADETGDQLQLNTDALQPGVYLLHINAGNQQAVKRFTKL